MPPISAFGNILVTQASGKPTLPKVDLSGKTYVVTGANTGLGYQTVKHLINLKASKVILGCRSLKKGKDAKNALLKESNCQGRTSLEVWEVDQAKFQSVLDFGSRVCSQLSRLDGFIANAGVELVEFRLAEGIEETITVNVVSTTMMALAVLPKLKESASLHGGHTNLTIVGSSWHAMAPDDQLDAPTDTTFIDVLSDETKADMAPRYGLSKLMVHLCTRELANRVDAASRVVVNWANPGWCTSDITRNRNKGLPERVMATIFRWTSEEGSRAVVYAAVAGPETHAQYVSENQVKQESPFTRSQRGQRVRERLWKETLLRVEKASPGIGGVVGK